MSTQPDSRLMCPGCSWSCRSFSTSNFDLWYFCSLLTYKSVQYLIWKIWFISVWRMKAKTMVWLITWFMISQSTLISYYTEAFFKTEVACTVKKQIIKFEILCCLPDISSILSCNFLTFFVIQQVSVSVWFSSIEFTLR